jgi:hypothetical protein
MKSIDLMQDELDKFENLLISQKKDTPVMITNSHVHAFDFIEDLSEDINKISIVNVDMHHDLVNNNNALDCGNWLSFLIRERENRGQSTGFRWVTNPVSLDNYGLDDVFAKGGDLEGYALDNLDKIKDVKFDGIFLCRSDTWTPPHLDKYFTEVCQLMKSHFDEILIEKGIDIPRTEYMKMAEQIKELNHKLKACRKEK